jgi:hypothetical protein
MMHRTRMSIAIVGDGMRESATNKRFTGSRRSVPRRDAMQFR